MTKRATIADIAQRAGLSKGAVSYALNGLPGVSESTRQRVLKLAAEMGWRPNSAARALSASRAGALGLVMARPASTLGVEPFFMKLLSGIENTLAARSTALVLQVVPDHDAEVEAYRRWWAERRVDGIFLIDLRIEDKRVLVLEELGLPAVVIGGPGHHGRLDRLKGALLVQLRHRLDQVQVEVAAGDGGDHQDRVGLLGQPGQPPLEHVAHPDWDLSPCGSERVVGMEVAFALEQPQQLGDEERVALGALVHGAHQPFTRPASEGGGDDAGDLALLQAAKRDPLHDRLAGQRAERLGQRLAHLCLHVAVGSQHDQTSGPELCGQETQQPQRSRVGPMEIIDDHQQRPSAPQPAQ